MRSWRPASQNSGGGGIERLLRERPRQWHQAGRQWPARPQGRIPAPGEQPYRRRGDPVPLTSMDPIERSRLVKLPEVQFLKRRLPGEPLVGPWK